MLWKYAIMLKKFKHRADRVLRKCGSTIKRLSVDLHEKEQAK